MIHANSHVHSPYSFSAFNSIGEIVRSACDENVKILGINDFYSKAGFKEFNLLCAGSGIRPMFNIEFVAMDIESQQSGTRFNDPNNPGRMYLVGKGMNIDFSMTKRYQEVIFSQVEHIKSIIQKINLIYSPAIPLTYENIKKLHGMDFIGERHVVREMKRLLFPDASENDIRNSHLKSGGNCFVKESVDSFFTVEECINAIKSAGGLPCYPVLFDHGKSKFTEFESDLPRMRDYLLELGIRHLDIIPDRNEKSEVMRLVDFFESSNFYVMFGTEHNTEKMKSLIPIHSDGTKLSADLTYVGLKGCGSVLAHQRGHSCDSWESALRDIK